MRLLRVAIVLLCLSLMGCGSGDDVAKQAPRAAKLLAGTTDGVDPAAAARNAGAGVSVAEAQQVKTQLQAGSSGLIGQLDQAVGTFTEEEYKKALKVACLASDSYQFITAKNDTDRQIIVNGQGESFGAKTAAVVGLTKDLVQMRNGSDAEKATASFICLGVGVIFRN
jgi:hypothetical protein